MRVSTRCVGTGLVLALALLTASARAEQPKAKPPVEPPQAEDVLRAMSTYLAKAKAFSYHGEIDFDQILPGGPKIRLSGAVDVAVARPGSLYVDYRDDVQDRLVWLQNGVATLVDPVGGTYAQVSGPKDIDGMVAKLEKEYGVSLPLGDLAESDPHAVLTRGIGLAHYVGVHNVEGIFCHHVVLQSKDIDLQIWVEVGDKPLPRKLVFDYPNRVGEPQYTVSITEWSFAAPKPGLFAPKIPKGAGKVDFLPIGEGR
jgi:hypothetical protein